MYDGFLVFIRQSVSPVVYFAGAGDGCKRMEVIYQFDDLVAVKESGDILGVAVVDGRLLVKRRTIVGVVADSACDVITPGIQLAAFGQHDGRAGVVLVSPGLIIAELYLTVVVKCGG